MPWVNTHTMLLHDELNLVDNCSPSSFNTQNSSSLNDVVRGRAFTNNSYGL